MTILLVLGTFFFALLTVVLVATFAFVMRRMLHSSKLSLRQKWGRGLLHFLWLAVLIFFLFPPAFQQGSDGAVLVHRADTPQAVIDSVRTHYSIARVVSDKDLERIVRDFRGKTFVFLGVTPPSGTLSHLAGQHVKYIPVTRSVDLVDVSWHATIHRGEQQTIEGTMRVDRPSVLRATVGGLTLDSANLHQGLNTFRLAFPAFAEGRTVISLVLDQDTVRSIAYYARPPKLLSIALLPAYPHLEARLLAEWLGDQGHRVEVITPVAKGTVYRSRVNALAEEAGHDVVIAAPSRASDPIVRRALSQQKGILFYGLDQVEEDLNRMNRICGTQFLVRSVGERELNTPVQGLTSAPFSFVPQVNQREVTPWPVALQQVGATVGASLLHETYPLRLAGDSLQYGQIWQRLLAAVDKSDSLRLRIAAPVYQGIAHQVALNTDADHLRIEKDSLLLTSTAAQSGRKSGRHLFSEGGWHALDNWGEIWVEEDLALSEAAWVAWLNANIPQSANGFSSSSIPPEFWLVIFVICLTALWVESKIEY